MFSALLNSSRHNPHKNTLLVDQNLQKLQTLFFKKNFKQNWGLWFKNVRLDNPLHLSEHNP